jgi:hypothetical protein
MSGNNPMPRRDSTVRTNATRYIACTTAPVVTRSNSRTRSQTRAFHRGVASGWIALPRLLLGDYLDSVKWLQTVKAPVQDPCSGGNARLSCISHDSVAGASREEAL